MANQLPNDVFFTVVFDYLGPDDLLNCQQVCRSWYTPAREKYLKHVKLKGDRAIEKFIATFDENPDQSYLNAVKTMVISSDKMVLDRNSIVKLLFRFRNLEKVQVDDVQLLKNFDQDLCQRFLSQCPKIKEFDVYADSENSEILLLENLRPLLTSIIISEGSCLNQLNRNVQEFIAQFPRLQSIFCQDDELCSFDAILSILKQLSDVRQLDICLEEGTGENVGEAYLSNEPKETQDLLKERLSNIETLEIYSITNRICNTLKFVDKYCTGLGFFSLEHEFIGHTANADADSYCKDVIDFIPSIDIICLIELNFLPFASLATNFTCLVQNMFQKAPAAIKHLRKRTLTLEIRREIDLLPNPTAHTLKLDAAPAPFSRRNASIILDEIFGLDRIASALFQRGVPVEVDNFVLCYDDIDSSNAKPSKTNLYLRLIETMTSLKKIELGVPSTFRETELDFYSPYTGHVLDQVEEATFTASFLDVTMQSLLYNCHFAFPNLKHLKFKRYNGLWNATAGEFQLDLPDYSLEKLTLDMTPLLYKRNQSYKNKHKFFVVQVDIESSNQQLLFKVTPDLSSCLVIHNSDLRGFKRRQNYLCLRLVIGYLKELELCSSNIQTCTVILC